MDMQQQPPYNQQSNQPPTQQYSTTSISGQIPTSDMGQEESVKYSVYLINNERIERIHDVGLYKVLRTNIRLILLGKVLKNIIALDYKDIERVEYYISIKWATGIFSLILGSLVYILYTEAASIWGGVAPYIPAMFSFINSPSLLGLSRGMLFIIFLITIIFLNRLYVFIFSFMGRVRVLAYGTPAIEIPARLTPDIQDIIKLIEQKKRFTGVLGVSYGAKENQANKRSV